MGDSDTALNCIMASLITALIVVIGLGACVSIREQSDWEKFSKEHNCKVVQVVKGSANLNVGNVLSSNGAPQLVVFTSQQPDRTVYKCDDGATYTR